MPNGFAFGDGDIDRGRRFYSVFEAVDSHKTEESRLKTFSLWPSSAQSSPEKLAATGFFYTGDSDTCQCFFCGLKLRNWRHTNDPRETHRRYAPQCVLVRGVPSENVPLKKDGAACKESGNPLPKLAHDCGTNENLHAQGQGACGGSDQMHDATKRLDTYSGKWRKSHVVKPEELARVGFYFTGDRHKVACAYCGVKLLNWQPGDTAYSEHFKHSPNCALLQKIGSERQRTKEFEDRELFLEDDTEKAKREPDSFPDGLPNFALSVVRQFGFSEAVVSMAVYRLKKRHGCKFADLPSEKLLDEIYQIQDALDAGKCQLLDPELLRLKEENDRLKNICSSCHTNPANRLLLPCRHIALCDNCSGPDTITCPRCSSDVQGLVKIYIV